jgi:hypothetical protein
MFWVILGVCVVVALVFLVLVDRIRGPIRCGACGVAISGRIHMGRVNGKRVRICHDCYRR